MPNVNPTPEEFFAALAAEADKPAPAGEPSTSPADFAGKLMEMSEMIDSMIDFTEGTRRKFVDLGYPESVSWRMAAELWAGIWRNSGS